MIYRNSAALFLVLFLAAIKPSFAAMDCTFFGSDEVAPGWVCDAPIDGLEVQVTGMSRASDSGIGVMMETASQSAREALGFRLQIISAQMLTQYFSGESVDPAKLDRINAAVAKQISKALPAEARIYAARQSKKGDLFILLGLDAEGLQKVVQTAIRSSKAADPAAWQ
jgi:hypothetical protein